MGVERDIGREPRSDAVCVVGIDLYNQCLTGGVAKTLNAVRDDADHVPCVLIRGGANSVWICAKRKR